MSNSGTMGVDWEIRVDFDRLRKERLAKAKEQLDKYDLGALVLYREENIRYVTSSWAGLWAVDKLPMRYCILPRGQDPILYTVGLEGAWHYARNKMPWLGDRVRQYVGGGRSSAGPIKYDRTKDWALDLKRVLQENRVAGLKVGFDILDVPMVDVLNELGVKFADGQAPMLEAQMIKTKDEIEILRQACTMATAAFWQVREALRPGIKECELSGVASQTLFSLGSEGLLDILCSSGPNSNPNSAKLSDRVIDWGDLLFMDIMHQHVGYQTCYYRAFVCGGKPTQKQRDLFEECRSYLYDAENAIKAGVTTADVAKVWPTADSLGLTPMEISGRYLAHSIGLSNHAMPFIVPGLQSLPYPPIELKENMVFAVETYAGDRGGNEGVRLEDDVVVTKTGVEVLTKFPLDELTG